MNKQKHIKTSADIVNISTYLININLDLDFRSRDKKFSSKDTYIFCINSKTIVQVVTNE